MSAAEVLDEAAIWKARAEIAEQDADQLARRLRLARTDAERALARHAEAVAKRGQS